MTAAATELQKAVYERLATDAALAALLGANGIFDRVPPGAAFPYVTFGRTSAYDWSTGTELGTEHLFTLHVWSKGKGRRETMEIMERIRLLLHDAPLAMETHRLANIRLEYAEERLDEDLVVHRGLMRFRAVTEMP